MPKIQITYPTVVFKTIEIDVPEDLIERYKEAFQSDKPKFFHIPDNTQVKVISEIEKNATFKQIEPDDSFPDHS